MDTETAVRPRSVLCHRGAWPRTKRLVSSRPRGLTKRSVFRRRTASSPHRLHLAVHRIAAYALWTESRNLVLLGNIMPLPRVSATAGPRARNLQVAGLAGVHRCGGRALGPCRPPEVKGRIDDE